MFKVALATVCLIAVTAPQDRRPPRDARMPVNTAGNGTVYGTVFGSKTGPLPATTVVLSSPNLNRTWSVRTDDMGGFRFESLPEGNYTLTGSHPQYLPAYYGQTFVGQEGRTLRLGAGQSIRADLVATRGSAITGQVLDIYGNPAMDVRVQAYRVVNRDGRRRLEAVRARSYRSNDIGQYRISNLGPGTYYLAAQPLLRDAAGASFGSAPGLAITWYPGTLHASKAQPVRVAVESETPVPTMQIVPVALAHVAGSLNLPTGVTSRQVMLQLVPQSEFDFTKQLRGSVDESGRFLFERVPPGTYVLHASSGGMPQSGTPVPTLTTAFYGHTTVQVSNGPVEGVSLVLSPPVTISGKLRSDTPLPDSAQIVVSTNYAEEYMGHAASASVDEDGAFKVPAAPGLVRLTVSGLPAGWVVEQIRGGGRDLELEGADTRNGGLFGVVVSLSPHVGQINGTVRGASAQSLESTVVVMAADARRRTPLLGGVIAIRPDSRGGFSATGLRSGRYVVAAVDYLSPSGYYDPAIWTKLESGGKVVAVERGGTVTISPPFVKLLR